MCQYTLKITENTKQAGKEIINIVKKIIVKFTCLIKNNRAIFIKSLSVQRVI